MTPARVTEDATARALVEKIVADWEARLQGEREHLLECFGGATSELLVDVVVASYRLRFRQFVEGHILGTSELEPRGFLEGLER